MEFWTLLYKLISATYQQIGLCVKIKTGFLHNTESGLVIKFGLVD